MHINVISIIVTVVATMIVVVATTAVADTHTHVYIARWNVTQFNP
jgi:hypothetical protein